MTHGHLQKKHPSFGPSPPVPGEPLRVAASAAGGAGGSPGCELQAFFQLKEIR